MATLPEYAILSAEAYNNSRKGANVLTPLQGWTEIPGLSDMSPTTSQGGFSATAYQKGYEIVIATTQFVTIY